MLLGEIAFNCSKCVENTKNQCLFKKRLLVETKKESFGDVLAIKRH